MASESTLYQANEMCRHTQVQMLNDATGQGSRCNQCGGTLMFVVPVEPDAWGIKTWDQLYRCMTVAENGGDWKECTDALGAALGIGDNDGM